jgi:hypothetical protein
MLIEGLETHRAMGPSSSTGGRTTWSISNTVRSGQLVRIHPARIHMALRSK